MADQPKCAMCDDDILAGQPLLDLGEGMACMPCVERVFKQWAAEQVAPEAAQQGHLQSGSG